MPGQTPARQGPVAASLPAGFGAVFAGRLLSNMSLRLVYAFLPAIGRGVGVSLATMGVVLAVRDLSGLVTPLVGRAVDRVPHRDAMVVGALVVGVLTAAAVIGANVVVLAVCLTLAAVGKALFDVAASAWVGDAVPFARRGRAIGTLELAWALSFFIGMPIAAVLIDRGNWAVPFVLSGMATVACGLAVRSRVALVPPRSRVTRQAPELGRLGFALVALGGAMGVAHQLLLVSYAAFFEDRHGLSVASLGLMGMMLGGAELVGALGTVGFTDRLGKQRSTFVGLGMLGPVLALMAGFAASLPLSLVLLAAAFLVFEFGFVSLLSLVTELAPDARGAALGMFFTGFTVGHAAGSLSGPTLYEQASFSAVALTAACLHALVAISVLTWFADPEGGS